MTQGTQTCRQCGAALSPDETRGLCPACLLQTTRTEDEEPAPVEGPVDTAWLEKHRLAVSSEPGVKLPAV